MEHSDSAVLPLQMKALWFATLCINSIDFWGKRGRCLFDRLANNALASAEHVPLVEVHTHGILAALNKTCTSMQLRTQLHGCHCHTAGSWIQGGLPARCTSASQDQALAVQVAQCCCHEGGHPAATQLAMQGSASRPPKEAAKPGRLQCCSSKTRHPAAAAPAAGAETHHRHHRPCQSAHTCSASGAMKAAAALITWGSRSWRTGARTRRRHRRA
jgi:hypothetical protein